MGDRCRHGIKPACACEECARTDVLERIGEALERVEDGERILQSMLEAAAHVSNAPTRFERGASGVCRCGHAGGAHATFNGGLACTTGCGCRDFAPAMPRTIVENVAETLLAEIGLAPLGRIGSNEKAAARAAVITMRERLPEVLR
jgi:hypothetical protein